MGGWRWSLLCLSAAAAGWGGWAAAGRALRTRDPVARAALLLEVERPAEAATLLAERLARQPYDYRAWMLEGQRRGAAGDFRGAEEAFAKVDADSQHYPEAQLRAGQAALLRHCARAAEAAFRNVLRTAPPGDPVWRTAGMALYRLFDDFGREGEANALGELLLKHADEAQRATLRADLTVRYVAQRSAVQRLAQLRRFAAGDPEDLNVVGALAHALLDDGRIEDAYAALAPALARPGPKPHAAWSAWIVALFESQRFDELPAALAAAPESCRREGWHHRAVAAVRQRTHDLPGALDALRQAMALDERDVPLHREVAQLARRLGHAELAALAERRVEVWSQRAAELTAAFKAWSDSNAARAPLRESARAAERLAAACAAMARPQAAEYYREMARRFAAEAARTPPQ